jgi:hypothetical protein
MLPRVTRLIIALMVPLIQGCASVQLISQQSVEDRIAQIKLGVTTRGEIETLFGTQHGSEERRWFYNFSDTAFEISERKTGTLSGVFPVAPATVATNTRALISLRFTDSGNVSALEVARFFDPPFINDYWYLTKDNAQTIIESVMRTAEANALRVTGPDKAAAIFTLVDEASNARMTVRLENRTLHITSTNPHDRLTSAYRVFSKKERAFINNVSAADFCIQ